MKINWFSPLPPAATDIANYTARVLPALRARAEIVVWTDQTAWDESLVEGVEVRRYLQGEAFWRELNRGDLSVYHIGNHHLFHNEIWQISHRHPGLVVLHDLCLHRLFYQHYVQQSCDSREYLRQIGKYYGEAGRDDVAGLLLRAEQHVDYLSERYPLTLLALENSLGALVHSPDAFELLAQENQWPVGCAPLPFPAGPRLRTETPAARFSSGPPYRLIHFGYLGRNRRLDVILRALAGYAQRHQFRLDVYGELADGDQWAAQVSALGLDPLVTLRGFVPEAALEAALEAAHLALNLRSPTMGEASDSQLRIWSHALPSLVSEAGWYASLSSDAVAFVRPSSEVADLQQQFDAFLNDPARFALMGERGRRLLEERHAPEAYADALLECAQMARSFRPQWPTRPLAARAGAEIAATLKANAPHLLTQSAGRAIYELFGERMR